ncbi:hypothetical protein ELQ90_10395 [Labedella phragmitis]|uniref:DUF6966 domain-containing protein n=1 Tax=Labedella phragmitis TaxID=2498849 RepID=A0A444PTI7_9MICO|nr:hypothetical protein [Labedella phragmitis]RWZ51179.1 hypothetical protein ELQ90_10395 [Labedella phragmitis]
MGGAWRSDDQTVPARALEEFADSMTALGYPTATSWADGFRSLAERLRAMPAAADRRALYRHVGQMLRGGMGSVNDLYSPEPEIDAAYRQARHAVGRIFGLSFARSLLDDAFLGRVSWYR